MTTGFRNSGGVDFDNVFDPYVQGTKPGATGFRTSDGVDLNQRFAPLSFGTAAAVQGYRLSGGADVNTLWAAKGTASYGLPINGTTYAATSQSGATSTSCTYGFSSGPSGWAVSGSSSSSGAVTPGASGALPVGASTVKFTLTLTTSNGTGTTFNSASTAQPVASSVTASVTATSTPATVESERWATLVITYFNASSVAISTTTIYLKATAQGSA